VDRARRLRLFAICVVIFIGASANLTALYNLLGRLADHQETIQRMLDLVALVMASVGVTLPLARRWILAFSLVLIALVLTLGSFASDRFMGAADLAPPPPPSAGFWFEGDAGSLEEPTVPWRAGSVPVCWENPLAEQAATRDAIEQAVSKAWEVGGQIAFSWRKGCPAAFPGVRVSLVRERTDASASVSRLGRKIAGSRDGLRLPLTFPAAMGCRPGGKIGSLEACITGDAVHEFGHVLGLNDNHFSRFAPEPCQRQLIALGAPQIDEPYDPDSAMNSCNPTHLSGKPSTGDLFRLGQLYAAAGDEFEQEFGRPHPDHRWKARERPSQTGGA
jgi:hypothetical protein